MLLKLFSALNLRSTPSCHRALPQPPRSILFPYTTLFRSAKDHLPRSADLCPGRKLMSLTLKLQHAAIAQEILAADKTRVDTPDHLAVCFHPAFIDQGHLEGRRVGPTALDQPPPIGAHPIV